MSIPSEMELLDFLSRFGWADACEEYEVDESQIAAWLREHGVRREQSTHGRGGRTSSVQVACLEHMAYPPEASVRQSATQLAHVLGESVDAVRRKCRSDLPRWKRWRREEATDEEREHLGSPELKHMVWIDPAPHGGR